MKAIKYLLGLGTLAVTADIATSAYFFKRTMIRSNTDTSRTMKMSGTNWEMHMPKIQKMKEFMQAQPSEDVYIYSKDGLKLHGTYFPTENSKKLVLCFHGYTSQGTKDYIGLSNFYISNGYQMLLVDERAHGESEGTYIGFGNLDRFDALAWIEYVKERLGEDCEIILHGISMGGATVLMTNSLNLPQNVKAMISDCAFTSAWEVFDSVLKNTYHLPSYPILKTSNEFAKKYAGFDLAECNAKEEVKKAKVPILFIHGNADTFVPCKMCYELYDNCASPKQLLIIDGAGHAECFYKETEQYEFALKKFLNIEGEVL